MINSMFSLLTGLIFGLGLILAGMSNPAKVSSFLDLAGAWDPSLAFVMGGAVATAVGAFTWAKRRSLSLLGSPVQLPTNHRIDRRLVGGSLLFGVGWGLAGICPGPAIILLASGVAKGALFAAAMAVGMALYEWLDRLSASHNAAHPTASANPPKP